MVSTREELKKRAKDLLHRNYWPLVGYGLVLVLATGGGSSSSAGSQNNGGSQYGGDPSPIIIFVTLAIVILIALFVMSPLEYGARSAFLHASEGTSKGRLTSGFLKDNYMRVVGTFFLRDLYIILWALLFIFPGIMKAYAYYYVPYLLEEHPEMSGTDVLRLSEEMTRGRKWDLFVLDLSFILWHILGSITFGLAEIFYVLPYMYLTETEMYHEMVDNGADPERPVIHAGPADSI